MYFTIQNYFRPLDAINIFLETIEMFYFYVGIKIAIKSLIQM